MEQVYAAGVLNIEQITNLLIKAFKLLNNEVYIKDEQTYNLNKDKVKYMNISNKFFSVLTNTDHNMVAYLNKVDYQKLIGIIIHTKQKNSSKETIPENIEAVRKSLNLIQIQDPRNFKSR